MWIIFEGYNPEGELVKAELPLIVALRGDRPSLPRVDPEDVSARISQDR